MVSSIEIVTSFDKFWTMCCSLKWYAAADATVAGAGLRARVFIELTNEHLCYISFLFSSIEFASSTHTSVSHPSEYRYHLHTQILLLLLCLFFFFFFILFFYCCIHITIYFSCFNFAVRSLCFVGVFLWQFSFWRNTFNKTFVIFYS